MILKRLDEKKIETLESSRKNRKGRMDSMYQRDRWKINELPELKKKDIYKPVCLNKYGYYELSRQNTREERNANFEEHYFQEYAGATYEKVEYPPEELKFLNNQIEERAYVIEQNLEKMGKTGEYSLLDTKLLGKLQEPYVPVDFREYKDIYVFCDSDPIGYYLNYKKIYYHAVEDGLNCIQYFDTARYDNRGHFGLKAWMSLHNLIFIQNGYGKYCLDMEVNDKSVVPYPCDKYIEQPRAELVEHLSVADKDILVRLFIRDIDGLRRKLDCGAEDKVLVLSEPLCDLKVRKQIFSDIIKECGEIDGQKCQILIKPHPRDILDYTKEFPELVILDGMFPMEILNFIPGLYFKKVVSVFTVPDAIHFAEETVFLGKDFMDQYEAPELHRQDEMI